MENLFSEGFIQVGRRLFKEHYWEEATPEQKVILLTLLSLSAGHRKAGSCLRWMQLCEQDFPQVSLNCSGCAGAVAMTVYRLK